MSEQVVLVDKNDQKLGLMDKLEAHRGKGHLHRAISVLLYRKKNGRIEVLLQQRSKNKLLWPLFWTNIVCTHPRDGESSLDCCVRRLKEEMGINLNPSDLTFIFTLLYQARYDEQFGEHELDSVFLGQWDGKPKINRDEGDDWKWMKWDDLHKEMKRKPQLYTPWFELMIKNKEFQILNNY